MSLPGVSPLFPSRPVVNPVVQPAASFLKREIEYVKGIDGANAYPLGPNSSVILPDQDMPVVWVVMTDQNGSKTMVKGYRLGEEYIPPKPVTMEDLMTEIRTLNERLRRVEGSNESDSKYADEIRPDGAGVSAGPVSGIRESAAGTGAG